jgi:hypothetical protein
MGISIAFLFNQERSFPSFVPNIAWKATYIVITSMLRDKFSVRTHVAAICETGLVQLCHELLAEAALSGEAAVGRRIRS